MLLERTLKKKQLAQMQSFLMRITHCLEHLNLLLAMLAAEMTAPTASTMAFLQPLLLLASSTASVPMLGSLQELSGRYPPQPSCLGHLHCPVFEERTPYIFSPKMG